MTEIAYKLVKILNASIIPFFAFTIFDSKLGISGKGKNSDNKKDEVPGDNYPSAVISHHLGKERMIQ